jgi:putative heme-binding domain-containing protein
LDGKGAIWRFDAPPKSQSALRNQTRTLLSAGFSHLTPKQLAPLLGHADQRVRLGAQFELVHRKNAELLLATARNTRATLFARLHSLWGLGQLLRQKNTNPAEILPLLKDAQPLIRANLAKVLSESDLTPEQAAQIIPLLADPDPRPQLHAAIALGRLHTASATTALIQFAEKHGTDPLFRHAAVTGLSGCASADQLAEAAHHASPAVRTAAVLALGRLGSPKATAFLSDPDPAIAAEAARAIHDGTGIPEALPALAACAESAASIGRRDFAARALNATLRIGAPEGAISLLHVSSEKTVPLEIREEALGALVAWSNPPRLDRVDGFARTITTRAIEDLLEKELPRLLSESAPTLRQAAVELMIAHGLKSTAETVTAIVSDSGANGTLRAGALRLMGTQHRSSLLWPPTLEAALSSNAPAELQEAALELLLPEKAEYLATQAERLLQSSPIPVKQRVVRVLAAAKTPECDLILVNLAQKLDDQKALPALQLDILEAAQTRSQENSDLAKAVSRYLQSPAGIAHQELQEGGRIENGKNLVLNHLGANCLACHAVGDSGSSVGPNLRSIGLQHPRAYLLEALIQPSAQVAKGYGIATVTLRDGTALSGTPVEESESQLVLRLPDNAQRKIARSDVESFTPPISLMPPMLGILSPTEIRDVVAYLSTLKAKPKANPEH